MVGDRVSGRFPTNVASYGQSTLVRREEVPSSDGNTDVVRGVPGKTCLHRLHLPSRSETPS